MFGAIEILAVVLLFIEPASYRLRSKGWRASPFVWGTALSMVAAYLAMPLVGLCGGLVFFSLPVLLFLVSLAISTRTGSPGVGYLRMVPGQSAEQAGEILTAAPCEEAGGNGAVGDLPAVEEDPEGDGVALRLLTALALAVVVPALLGAAAYHLGPILLPGQFPRGFMSSGDREILEMRSVLLVLVICLGAAVATHRAPAERPRQPSPPRSGPSGPPSFQPSDGL